MSSMAGKKEAEKQAPESKGLDFSTLNEQKQDNHPAIPQPQPSEVALPPADQGNISLPRIVVLQPSSREVNAEGEDKQQAGTFYNRLLKTNLGTSFAFQPLHHYRTRIRMEQNVGLRCRSRNMSNAEMLGGKDRNGNPTTDCSACVYRLWPRDREALGEKVDVKVRGPECNEVDNFPALLVDEDVPADERELILIQFSRTSARAGDDLKSMWTLSRKAIWSFIYKVRSIRKEGPNGQPYYRQEVSRLMRNGNARATDDELKAAEHTMEFLKGRDLDFELDEEEANAGGGLSDEEKDRTARSEATF